MSDEFRAEQQQLKNGDKIWGMLLRRLDRIENQVEEIFREMRNSPSSCPAPGTCLDLKEVINEMKNKEDKVEERVNKLEKWQSRIMAIAGLGIILMGLFAPEIRGLLGLVVK